MTPMQKVDILRAACCIAGCDGEITVSEQSVISRLAAGVGVGKASLDAMVDRALRDTDFHKEQFRVLKADPQESFAALLEVALVDGQVGPEESVVLKSFAEKLEVPEAVFEQVMTELKNN